MALWDKLFKAQGSIVFKLDRRRWVEFVQWLVRVRGPKEGKFVLSEDELIELGFTGTFLPDQSFFEYVSAFTAEMGGLKTVSADDEKRKRSGELIRKRCLKIIEEKKNVQLTDEVVRKDEGAGR